MQKSIIISSSFWVCFITQFPGGYLCRRVGAKATMLVSVIGSAVLALLIPVSVEYGGWQAFCGIRVGQGLFQGLLSPCVYANLAAWCPVNELNRLGALVTMGSDWGAVLSMFATGMIAASPIGWPGISYFTSGFGLTWCVLWLFFSANSPNESKRISAAEKAYIEDSKSALRGVTMHSTQQAIPVPWHAILTSGPFLALIVTRASEIWGFFTLQTEIPAYMNGVLGMDIKENAFFSALPFLAMICMSYVYLILSYILLKNNILSLNGVRKVLNSVAFWLPALGLIVLGFVNKEQKVLAIVLLTAIVAIHAGNIIGSGLNTIDLSPNHAGILMGIVNTIALMLPMMVPLVVAVIVEDQTDRTEWQIIFALTAIVFAIGNLIFVIFGSTNLQPWDDANFLASKNAQDEIISRF